MAKVFGQIALMSLSTYKSHYLVIDKDILNKFVEFDDKNFHDVHEQMLFGITINKDLSLQGYTESILQSANKVLNFCFVLYNRVY